MTRNGITIPLPSEFATPPDSSSQTGRGSCGFRLWRYAATAFRRRRAYLATRNLPMATANARRTRGGRQAGLDLLADRLMFRLVLDLRQLRLGAAQPQGLRPTQA